MVREEDGGEAAGRGLGQTEGMVGGKRRQLRMVVGGGNGGRRR